MPTYTLTTGRKNEKMGKVAGQFPSCLRHRGNWPATFLSFAFLKALDKV